MGTASAAGNVFGRSLVYLLVVLMQLQSDAVARHPPIGVPTVQRKQAYMDTVADPVLTAIMEMLVAAKPTGTLATYVASRLDALKPGSNLPADLAVDSVQISEYCAAHADPFLKVRRHLNGV